ADVAEGEEEDSKAEGDGDIPEDVEADREPEEDTLQDDGEYEPEGYDENDSEEYDEGYDEEEDSVPVRYSSKSARPELKVYVPAAEPDEEPAIPVRRKKHKGLKICGLLLAMFVVVAGCAYAGISYYYSDRFFQGTWINGIDCSGKTAYETELALSEKIQDYSIQVSARNQEPQVITGDQINYQYLSTGETLALLKNQKPYEWIKGFYQRKSYTVSENTYYDRTLLQNQVTSLNCARTENQVAPENAYVAYKDNQFQ